MRLEISGSSDDNIEIEGDITEEFGVYGKSYLHFGDGTVLEMEYAPDDDDDYYWRIKRVKQGTATLTMAEGTYHGEDGMKCDKAILEGDLKSVKCWGSAEGPTDEDLEQYFDSVDWRDLHRDTLLRIMDIIDE